MITVVYDSPELTAKLEEEFGETFLHCDVRKNSPSSIKKLKSLLAEVKKDRKERGIVRPLFSYTQNPQFAKLMGGVYLSEFDFENRHYEIWMWE